MSEIVEDSVAPQNCRGSQPTDAAQGSMGMPVCRSSPNPITASGIGAARNCEQLRQNPPASTAAADTKKVLLIKMRCRVKM